MDTHEVHTMTLKDYVVITVAICAGVIPGVMTYRYISQHSDTIAFLSGSQSSEAITSYAGTMRDSKREGGVDVLTSRPQKTTDALCPNSYYMSTLVAVKQNGTFAITQLCESKKDAGNTWYGTTSHPWAIEDEVSGVQTLALTVLSDARGALAQSESVVLSRNGEEISVASSTLPVITSTSTFFTYDTGKVLNSVPQKATPKPEDLIE